MRIHFKKGTEIQLSPEGFSFLVWLKRAPLSQPNGAVSDSHSD